VAILSAAMSSISSALTSLASVSTMDFVKALYRGGSEEFYLRFSKYSTVAWAAALIGIAYLTRQVEFVLNAAFSLRGLTSGALLGGLLLAVFGRKGGPVPVIVGMLVSLAVMIGVSQFEWVERAGPPEVKTRIFWPWFTLIGTIVTLTTAWLTRLLMDTGKATAQTTAP
jgi:Na+/proline symporter